MPHSGNSQVLGTRDLGFLERFEIELRIEPFARQRSAVLVGNPLKYVRPLVQVPRQLGEDALPVPVCPIEVDRPVVQRDHLPRSRIDQQIPAISDFVQDVIVYETE